MKAQVLIKIIERNPNLTVEMLAEKISSFTWDFKIFELELNHFYKYVEHFNDDMFFWYLHRRGYTGRDIAFINSCSESCVSKHLMKVRTNKEKYDLNLIEKML